MTSIPSQIKAARIKAGRPKQPETVTPGLRIRKDIWKQFSEKYRGQANKMFLEFIIEKLKNK